MDNINETFITRLGAFIELLKETQKTHVDYILRLTEWQKQLLEVNKQIKQTDSIEVYNISDKPDLLRSFQQNMEDAKSLKNLL